MFYTYRGEVYLLNLIDTPGHVDFNYEVSRTMRSCNCSLLVVDATQGIQAQTISNYELAYLNGLKILPVINKIDMPSARVAETKNEILHQFEVEEKDIRCVSAKTGQNVEQLLLDIIEKVPPPKVDRSQNFKGFLIGSWYENNKGVIMLMDIKQGSVQKGNFIMSHGF